MSNDGQLPVKKTEEGTKLLRLPKGKRVPDESKKWENIRARKIRFADIASRPTVIDARIQLEMTTGAARRDKAKLMADLTKDIPWDDLVDVLYRSMSMFVQDERNYTKVHSWIYNTLRRFHVGSAGASIFRSVIALYPLTVNTELIITVEIAKWLRTSRWNKIDLIPILTGANQLLSCAKSVMTSASRVRIIKDILHDETEKDEAAKLCKSIIQLAGEAKYQEALDSLTVKYNTKHELVATTCRCAEFYRRTGLLVCCVTHHKNVRFMGQYRHARDYFKQTHFCDDLPLFFVKVDSVTKSGIRVKVTMDHDVPSFHNDRFLFGTLKDQGDDALSLRFTPGTNSRCTATGVVSSPIHAQGRLVFEEDLPAIADEVQLLLPTVCTNIVLQYVQLTLRELICNGR
jgi:hypothetical protein